MMVAQSEERGLESLVQWARILGAAAAATAASAALSGDAAEPTRNYQLQLGIGFAAPYNLEEPFLNAAKARPADWSFETGSRQRMNGQAAVKAGFLDPKTYLPTSKASEAKFGATAVFYSGAEQYPSYYADDYVLDWKGEAQGLMQRWDSKAIVDRQKNSITYSLKPAQAKGGAMRFTGFGDGFSDIRLYRKKYASLLNRGEIWNPEFIKYVRRYDILRTMDLQYTNNFQVRRFDQIAKMSDPWGQRAAITWPEPPFFSIPYEVLFNLGVKADTAIWLTLPPQIGSPISAADPSLRGDKKTSKVDSTKLRAAISAKAGEILASPEWDIFAKAFVDRYIASGYPQSRPLYVEVGNEIWNFANGFWISSHYALAIAEGVADKKSVGSGYGVLVARYMMALDKEFAARKIKPNIVYVIASHTANPWRTQQALEGFAFYLKKNGVDPKTRFPRTAVAVTNYYAHFSEMSLSMFGSKDPKVFAPLWIAEIEKDPDGFARRVSSMITDGPKNVKATGPYMIARFKEHQVLAEQAGSRFLGGYEGGSHFTVPKELSTSKTFRDWWMAYHWSEQGADVCRRINNDLIKAFPGIVISNYKSIGTLAPDTPWNDGHYAKPTPMMEMWDEFARPDRLQ
ncbi:MAG: hypothetical protein A3E78_16120 [Alphaproteobacteria bacterium RIFCSPHIGHO2_12_FULL_63_12]|nr:MAG: hypothetical protein A3E78_16120 [Alphaproteobacteria bacterium RIFCSPHIGHO2_12_FULL_63_12]